MAGNRSALLAVIALCCGLAVAADERSERATVLYEQTFGAAVPDPERISEALTLWRELAAEDPKALYYLSAAYMQGAAGLLDRNEAHGITLLMEAAEKEVPEAQFALAWQYESGEGMTQDFLRALAQYENAAAQGYALAISRMIRVYSLGELGVSPNDAKADYWRRRREQER